MRAATYAHAHGLSSRFALAAFRLAFAEGKDLAAPEHVLDAARSAGLDPAGAAAAIASDEVKAALRDATAAAHQAGVFGVPTVIVDGDVYWGDDRLEEAALALRGT
jgi:2-hydroxychromene-2-carboxylate isomerase